MGGKEIKTTTGGEFVAHVIPINYFNVVMEHLPGKTDGIADALSRKKKLIVALLHHSQTEHPLQPLDL